MKKDPISIFYNRMKKIGIEIEMIGNYPWVYLDKVNGKKVKGKFHGDHGFTIFMIPALVKDPTEMTDISVVFKKIRETLNS